MSKGEVTTGSGSHAAAVTEMRLRSDERPSGMGLRPLPVDHTPPKDPNDSDAATERSDDMAIRLGTSHSHLQSMAQIIWLRRRRKEIDCHGNL
jgi:hypothetical protein